MNEKERPKDFQQWKRALNTNARFTTLSYVLSIAAGHLSSARKSYWQLARFQKLHPKWDKMSHFSEFV